MQLTHKMLLANTQFQLQKSLLERTLGSCVKRLIIMNAGGLETEFLIFQKFAIFTVQVKDLYVEIQSSVRFFSYRL